MGGGVRTILCLWMAFGFFAGKAWATRWVPLTPEQLAERAERIVHAKVEALNVQRDAAGAIFTRVDLAVLEMWKGAESSARCEIVVGGGVLGEVQESSEAAPQFAPGEEVVVFLVRNNRGEWLTLGMAQGQFFVERDRVTGEAWVHNRFWGSPPERSPSERAVAAAFPKSRPLTLTALRARVRVRGEGGGR